MLMVKSQPTISVSLINCYQTKVNTQNPTFDLKQDLDEQQKEKNDDWHNIGYKKKRRFDIGKNVSSNTASTVPKLACLHVTRLEPNTDLRKCWKQSFRKNEKGDIPKFNASFKLRKNNQRGIILAAENLLSLHAE
ncbi:hypothetical protein JTB14_012726 [Gonioctena quinquepunctata]|nr:hypothetical protein JTB14_012726 [Gonioctena quinquepunctata]